MEFQSQNVCKTFSILFSAKFGPFSNPFIVHRPCTMNVQNEPVHGMFFVLKRETPPVWRWKLCEFQHRKSISRFGNKFDCGEGVRLVFETQERKKESGSFG